MGHVLITSTYGSNETIGCSSSEQSSSDGLEHSIRGVDTRTGVDDKDYQPPFRITGSLNKLTIKLVPPK
jgi:hypothetical protein